MPAAAWAQRPESSRSVQPEVRADAIIGRRPTLHGGVGLNAPLGTYVRLEVVAAAGTLFTPSGPRFSARTDAVARFLLDPFRQIRRGPYAGAGVSVRRESARTLGDLIALVGIEGRTRRGYAPSVELGLGGGVRLGVVFRHARADRR